ncbi:MAG: phage tail protein [Acidobacteria bacterium]|nr:phage tail protein [Acidobacteriota bacterium]
MRRLDDPFPSFRFLLELGSLQVGGFQECTGLQLETKVFEYPEGGRNTSPLKFPERGAVSNITLKRGMVAGSTSAALYNWHLDVMTGSFDSAVNPHLRPFDAGDDIDDRLAIVLRDERGEELKRWRLFRAFPVKWTGPEMKADSSTVAVEALEIACEGLEMI